MKTNKIAFTVLLIAMFLPIQSAEKGTVYLVVGSDTAIWDGLSLSRYDNRYFNGALYSDPNENAYAVMDTSFRYQLRDSYGTPMKMTWWMMAGNVFHLSKNCNIPIRNSITLYLMKKYHLDAIHHYDDQLTLHYHNYYWSDTNNDGIYYWNQGLDFTLNQEDYEECLMKYLIEDDVFPISFRSGWHFMDNAWQAYQERFIPFDMSNAYPSHGGDYSEPTNNIIDWSESPSAFVPYHPNADNYQIEGDLWQWRLRSVMFTSLNWTRQNLETMFQEAANGNDQMGCYWSHLPQTDFLSGMDSLNAMAHRFSEQYGVDFMYCKDTEAMRLWINPADTIPPVLTVNEIVEPQGIRFAIATDGPVFQVAEPFIAAKTVYETYERLDCRITGENQWETIDPIPANQLAKISVAVCDSVGNQAKAHLDYVPDDLFIDDSDAEFQELSGNWADHTSGQLWDLNARKVHGDGLVAITPDIPEAGTYSILFHGPGSDTDSVRFLMQNGTISDTVLISERLLGSDAWQHIGFFELEAGSGNTLTIENLASDKDLGLDVIRCTPLVADKHFVIDREILTFGEVSVTDTVIEHLHLSNFGKQELTVSALTFYGNKIDVREEFPLVLAPMETRAVPVIFYTDQFCEYNDIIRIETDDPQNPLTLIPVLATALTYYQLVDNEDPSGYQEFGGGWFTSVATSYRETSRCVYISANGSASGKHADFTATLKYSGTYELQFIVPKTVNAHNHADYIVLVNDSPIDTVVVNQNNGSGAWVSIGEFDLPKELPITLRIQDNGGNTNTGSVLRADAVKFTLLEEKYVTSIRAANIPLAFRVYQNYPNPFNPSTEIVFSLPQSGEVSIDFFDLQGKRVDRQIKQHFDAGYHTVHWTPQTLPSGMYLYRVQSESGFNVKKCTFMK